MTRLNPATVPTKQQIKVFQMVADGLYRAEIADTLHISRSTVNAHITQTQDRLDTWTTGQTLAEMIRRGYIK